MRRWIIGGILFSLLLGSTAYAHISGAFGDFLVGIKDEGTTEKLKNEIIETKKEIEQLTPKVKKMQAEYKQNSGAAVSKLQFYNTIGLDTYMNFILQSADIVDILANQRLIEKKLDDDLRNLNKLYLTYMPLKLSKESLEGHTELLQMIQDNLQARKEFFAANSGMTQEELVNLALNEWNQKAGSIDDALMSDAKLLNINIKEFVTQKTAVSPYRLEDTLFNAKSKLVYYFRSDHVYIHYQKKNADVILIGTIEKKDDKHVSLHFEAGFLNGILFSGDLLKKLPGFQLDYTNLNPKSKDFYAEQTNGAIVIQPAEQAVE